MLFLSFSITMWNSLVGASSVAHTIQLST